MRIWEACHVFNSTSPFTCAELRHRKPKNRWEEYRWDGKEREKEINAARIFENKFMLCWMNKYKNFECLG